MSISRKRDGERSGELVKAGDLPFLAELAQDIEQCTIESEIIRPEDIAYTHSIFLQCFLPLRHRPSNVRRWETGNRLAKLVIRAGELVNPDSPGTFKECAVPAGPKARLLVTYINDYAFRHKTPLVPLGESLREAMRKMDVPVGGKNGKELHRELENIAAAEINLGTWAPDGGSARHQKASVAEEMSFWMEKDSQQRTLWQPEMLLSTQYYRALCTGGHIAPIHWEAYIALQHNARAMDIFVPLLPAPQAPQAAHLFARGRFALVVRERYQRAAALLASLSGSSERGAEMVSKRPPRNPERWHQALQLTALDPLSENRSALAGQICVKPCGRMAYRCDTLRAELF
jgi:hypothetical protein